MDVAMGDIQSPARPDDQVTPTAPQLPFLAPTPSQAQIPHSLDLSSQKTPTRDSFAGAGGEKRPYEPAPVAESGTVAETPNKSRNRKSGSHNTSEHRLSQDVDMENNGEDGGSDNESTADGSGRPSKKKKGQRFFCTDFPPCQLSFTRSEHLARHIRKHTGERPFQCHCLRRFSRLDNLRQHAQTVHVNEEIPGDSLAATSTRFQRQVRTDRVRPANGRARASTLGSNSGSHGRGHSRNLSGSSIGSTSDFGSPDASRRQPPLLARAQATPPRPGLTLDTYSATTMNNDAHYPPNFGYSPSGYSTPTSVFSNDASSPRAPSGLQSPIAMVPRPIGWGGQNHSRRLSVPSGANPFQSPGMHHATGTPFMSPLVPSSASAFPNAFGSSTRGSQHEGQPEALSAAEAEWRRRTWHPGTRMSTESRPATSGLTYYQTPDAPQPISSSQPAAQQAIRLPGIDSFDRAHAQPIAPPRRAPSEMDVDEQSQAGETDTSSKRDSWNSVNQNFNQLDLAHGNSSQEALLWRHSTGSQPPVSARPTTAPHSGFAGTSKHVPPPLALVNSREPPMIPADKPTTPKKKKRQGMYVAPAPEPAGPPTAIRTSPEGSSSSGENIHTPSTYPGAELRPAIVHSNGSIEALTSAPMAEESQKERQIDGAQVTTSFPMQHQVPSHPATSMDQNPLRRSDDTGRLDALVAVATGDGQAFASR